MATAAVDLVERSHDQPLFVLPLPRDPRRAHREALVKPPTTLRHGHNRRGQRSREYQTWAGLRPRCHVPTDKLYPYYGARGITVCDRWQGEGGFENFLADMGARPAGKSLDRIDNSKGYSPENCRWATRGEQMRNTRRARFITIEGRTQCLKDWAIEYGVDYKRTHNRIRKGWDPVRALTAERRGAK